MEIRKIPKTTHFLKVQYKENSNDNFIQKLPPFPFLCLFKNPENYYLFYPENYFCTKYAAFRNFRQA